MVGQQIIHDPLTKEDLVGLGLLEKVWWKKEILRAQLVKFSKKGRLKLIETADLKTKWERYAYSRLIDLPPKKNLPMNKLVSEIELTFDFILKPQHIKRLYRVKQMVYNQRKKTKKISKKHK